MQLAHETSQSGGYHHFLSIPARQLQRFVRQRRDWKGRATQRERAAKGTIPPRSGGGPPADLPGIGALARRTYLRSSSRSVAPGAPGLARAAPKSVRAGETHALRLLMMRPDRRAA